MATIESTIPPRSLMELLRRPLPEDMQAMRSILFDVALWIRGDMQINVTNPAISATAGQLKSIVIEPDVNEEWELLYAFAYDNANIDKADEVFFAYKDNVTANTHWLQMGTAQAFDLTNVPIGAGFPNRDTTAETVKGSIVTSVGDLGFLLRRRDGGKSWQQFLVQWKASATVGTRSIQVTYTYKRRRLI